MKSRAIQALWSGLGLAGAYTDMMLGSKYPGSEHWSRSKYAPHYGKNAAARNLARCK